LARRGRSFSTALRETPTLYFEIRIKEFYWSGYGMFIPDSDFYSSGILHKI
jgi:hypothetical protein